MKRLVALVALIAGLATCGSSSDKRAAREPSPGLLAQMKQAFAKSNPRVAHIHLLNLIADSSRPGHSYAALATATTASPVEVSDELFGVFVVDSTLTRVQDVIETFTSGRLLDYTVLISFPAPDTLLVRGFGMMDSESSIRHAHVWRP